MIKILKAYRLGEQNLMSCGMIATIINYRNCEDIDIKFSDGTIVQHRQYQLFKKGTIVNPNIIKKYKPTTDITGNKYGRLTVIKFDEERYLTDIKKYNSGEKSHYPDIYWICKCECGNTKSILKGSLIRGDTQSCGCLQKEKSSENGKKMLTKYGTIRQERPNMIKYLVNEYDADTYSIKSSKTIKAKCPNCNYIKNIKVVDLANQGFACPICSDGISYPEKFMANLLYESKINFTYQQKFRWSKNKRYDFYLVDYNCIIETHGIQHYRDIEKWDGLKYTQSNDKFKQENAYKNGIKNYYVVDCRKSDSSYILKSIERCGSNDLLKIDIDKLDIDMIDKRSHNSLLITICEEFSRGLTQKEIRNKYKLDWTTIIKYLKIGNNIGVCVYETKYKKQNRMIPIVCNDYLQGFQVDELITKYKLNYSTILRYLKKGGIVYQQKTMVQVFKNNELVGEYDTQKECAEKLNINIKTISSALRGKQKTCKGYILKYRIIGE